jgi:RNA polymerase sigma factor (sigma-70 family)
MIRSPTSPRFTCGLRLQHSRQRAGLSRVALAAVSGVDPGFIHAVENNTLCDLISAQEIQHAVSRYNGRGPQRIMQRTLLRWADDLHRLADALADNFENLFPAADLAALSDQLWFKIHNIQQQFTTTPSQPSDHPWHDWGWYRNVALSDDLIDETVEDQFDACELRPVIRELLAGLEPREQIVIALRYGFNGAPCSRSEVARRLGLTSHAVRGIEQRALRRLQHPHRSRRLRDYLK